MCEKTIKKASSPSVLKGATSRAPKPFDAAYPSAEFLRVDPDNWLKFVGERKNRSNKYVLGRSRMWRMFTSRLLYSPETD